MKLRKQSLTQPQISRHEVVHESEKTRRDEYVHPWYEFINRPQPPTEEAVKKAEFVDKTYKWTPKAR